MLHLKAKTTSANWGGTQGHHKFQVGLSYTVNERTASTTQKDSASKKKNQTTSHSEDHSILHTNVSPKFSFPTERSIRND